MSNQAIDKVDLSLDDIIKLNKKKKQQGAQRGGTGRGRGVTGQRGRGGRGVRFPGIRRGRGRGISPLNRQTGAASGSTALSGRAGRGGGQRGGAVGPGGGTAGRGTIARGRGRGRGTAGRGTIARGRGRGRGTAGRGTIARGRGRGRGTAGRGTIARGRGRGRGIATATAYQSARVGRTAIRGTRGNLRGSLRGARGTLQGSVRGRGKVTVTGQAVAGSGQGRGAGAASRVSLKEKRQLALQALRQARLALAQIDQHTARQNFVNARRGLIQQNQALSAKRNQGLYSSTTSLASTTSQMSSGSGRQLQGTKVTTFTAGSQQTTQRKRRWRASPQKMAPLGKGTSTLTISFDNPTPALHPQTAATTTQPLPQRQKKRRPWRRQNNNNNNNNNNSSIPSSSNNRSSRDDLDHSMGASLEFSQQLVNLAPSVSTKYVFQKKAFSSANTSCSLNERFSGSSTETLVKGRKVFL